MINNKDSSTSLGMAWRFFDYFRNMENYFRYITQKYSFKRKRLIFPVVLSNSTFEIIITKNMKCITMNVIRKSFVSEAFHYEWRLLLCVANLQSNKSLT